MLMNDTLKRSCEKCTKSKVKCEYGSAGCKRCVAKGFVCVYRPKRKRGPQDKKSKLLKKAKSSENNDDSFYSAVSSYERRIWSVFFTIFKHHQRLDSSTWAWCWFAQQLRKVRNYLEQTGNKNSLRMLSTWLEALKLDVISVNNQYQQQCKFNPSLCASCSATALSAPNKQGQLYGSLPGLPIVTQEEIDANDGEVDSNLPLLECYNTGQGSLVKVNEEFEKVFGFNGDQMNKLLEWSGGGFLPWGGDLLAKLVVKETDLHEFLQILALKFKSLGSPESKGEGVYEDVRRRVPSVHIFQLWTVGQSGQIDSKQSFYLRCLHFECIQNNRMSTQMKIAFKSVGERVKDTVGQRPVDIEVPKPKKEEVQVVTDLASPRKIKTEKDLGSDTTTHIDSSYKSSQATSVYTGINQEEMGMVDRIPEELKEFYDWSEDAAYSNGASKYGENTFSNLEDLLETEEIPVSNGTDVDMSFLDALMPQESTLNVLSPVLNNASYSSPLEAFVGDYVDKRTPDGNRRIINNNGVLILSGKDVGPSPPWQVHAKHNMMNPRNIQAQMGSETLGAELQPNGDLKWFDGNVWTRKL